jgi:hypothetical protein
VNFVLRSTLALIVLALVPALVSHTQTKASPATSFPTVVVSVPRPVSKSGEPVEVIATLENAGTESLYVPKGLNDFGFDLELLSSGAPYCQVVADFVCTSAQKALNRKAVEQLLNEYFLLLPPGGLVGIHTRLRTSCPLAPRIPALAPGKYEVTVSYSGEGVCVPDLSKKDTKFPVLQSTVRGAPVQVELTE